MPRDGQPVRRSSRFFWFTAVELALLGLFAGHATLRGRASLPELERKRQVVRHLRLTDLALFTEARYTRHPSQADLASAFQDHPFSLEHFPSGSLVAPAVLGLAVRPAGR